MSRKDHTTGYVDEKSWIYPRSVSIRADELIDELDDKQIQLLYNELRTKSVDQWLHWLEDGREKMHEYDLLTSPQRKHLLQTDPAVNALSLHHACIYVELWRSRISRRYFWFPPSGESLDTPPAQRRAMLDIVAAHEDLDPRDFWPFQEHKSPFLDQS